MIGQIDVAAHPLAASRLGVHPVLELPALLPLALAQLRKKT